MTEQELQRQRDHEEDLIRLRGFRPIDDTFMRVLFRDNLPLAEYVLRLLTGKPDLRLCKEDLKKAWNKVLCKPELKISKALWIVCSILRSRLWIF